MVLLLMIMLVGVSAADPVNVELVSSFSGSYSDVAVNGNYAYLLQDQDLVIVDITNPSNPVEAGRIINPSTAYGITISGNYAYVADGDDGLVIIDVSNPAVPTIKGTYDTDGWTKKIVVSGKYAYVG